MIRTSSLSVILSMLVACGGTENKVQEVDTSSSGSITISCDESLKPIIEAEEAVFEQLYPKADLNIIYTSEVDAMKMVLQDSARLAIITRTMSKSEEEELKSQKISRSRSTKIALDAIGFILHPKSKDTLFTVDQIKGILDGSISNWNQINPKSPSRPIQVVFDSPKSGAIRMLKDSLGITSDLGKNCYALKANPEVINHVEQNPNSIGIIGVSWISDPDDTLVRYFMKKIKVADIQPKNERVKAITWKPIQGNIHLRQYPFWREVYMVSREARTGLGTGFVAFVSGDQGQRIILKAGLVPTKAPVRTVEIKTE